eukprot:385148-Rhodomonas_salina.1
MVGALPGGRLLGRDRGRDVQLPRAAAVPALLLRHVLGPDAQPLRSQRVPHFHGRRAQRRQGR